MRAHQRLLITLLCLAIACIALNPLAAVAQDAHPVPTAAQMLADPTVSAAITQAWTDSQAGDKNNRHEEGGWIVQNTETGALSVHRWPKGTRSSITPSARPHIPCHRVVGHFHTHPNPPEDEEGTKWMQGPSSSDTNFANNNGLPGIIRNAAGTETCGPATADPAKNPHTPLPVEESISVIEGVPDTDQPPTEELEQTNPTNYCAPMAIVNILYYWDVIMDHPNAIGVTAGLPPETAAEYLGYFMDTNNTGTPELMNPPHAGTYSKDVGPGMWDFVRWDETSPPPTPPPFPLPAEKNGRDWATITVYEADFMLPEQSFVFCQYEIDQGRPFVVSFRYWNPVDTGLRFNAGTGQKISVFAWGEPAFGSEDPVEEWNWQEGYEGIGHAVTVVGYVPNWDPEESDTPIDYVIVHDNWSSTPSYIAIPFENWNSIHAVDPSTEPEY